MKKRDFDPIHPGEILLEEFLRPMGISQYRLAKDIGVPQRRISEITQGKRAITADTALRLGRYFGMEPQFWLNLQSRYELLKTEMELGERLDEEVKPHAA
ncbi:addiction module antidote protein, HigA family [Candidatus Parcubacteria bacterium]|nr:MAG: addiction module antidote protein, HigA family [Candidatus Parcubacteria bacterium]